MDQSVVYKKERDSELTFWRKQELKALELIKIAGDLRFDKGIEFVIFRNDIYDARPSEVLLHLGIAKNYTSHEVTIDHALEIAKHVEAKEDLSPLKIDLGKMATDYLSQEDAKELSHFVDGCIETMAHQVSHDIEPTDVVLYGFGRIGRLLARRIVSTTGRGDQLRLKAIVLRPKLKDLQKELEKRAALFRSDSVHGDFQGIVRVDAQDSSIIVNGNKISVIFASSPDEIDYTEYGIQNALLIDNTGVWRDRAGLEGHKRPGIDKVLLTAPGKDIPNLVYGVNHHNAGQEDILSAASCTTNAIVPIIETIDRKLGIEKGHIETIHAYTSDQNLLDNFHKKPRRGKAAALNMVLTSTGAAKAVSKVLPHLKGVLTGNAVRVPTPDVSLAIMNLTVSNATNLEELNRLLRYASLRGEYVEQIHFSTDTEYVSSNAIGMTQTSVVDAASNIVSADGQSITVYAWYDNEYGYCCQVVRLAKHIANVRRPRYY